MEIAALKSKAADFIKKYRYVMLIVLIGVVFMLVPGKADDAQQTQLPAAQKQQEESASDLLADILSQIEGAGKVQVLLTVASGEETLYQTDDERPVGESSGTVRVETVLVSDADRNQTGLVRQINPPTYLGAIIVCQGADSPRVQLAIVDAVSKVTGLGADCISVLKMK